MKQWRVTRYVADGRVQTVEIEADLSIEGGALIFYTHDRVSGSIVKAFGPRGWASVEPIDSEGSE